MLVAREDIISGRVLRAEEEIRVPEMLRSEVVLHVLTTGRYGGHAQLLQEAGWVVWTR